MIAGLIRARWTRGKY